MCGHTRGRWLSGGGVFDRVVRSKIQRSARPKLSSRSPPLFFPWPTGCLPFLLIRERSTSSDGAFAVDGSTVADVLLRNLSSQACQSHPF